MRPIVIETQTVICRRNIMKTKASMRGLHMVISSLMTKPGSRKR